MNSDFVPIGQASKILGVSIQTLRNWEKTDCFRILFRLAGLVVTADADSFLLPD